MPLSLEGLIPNDDSVRLLSRELEDLDYSKLYQAYSAKGRNPAVDPKTMGLSLYMAVASAKVCISVTRNGSGASLTGSCYTIFTTADSTEETAIQKQM